MRQSEVGDLTCVFIVPAGVLLCDRPAANRSDGLKRTKLHLALIFLVRHFDFAGIWPGEAALGSLNSGEDSDIILRRKVKGMDAVKIVRSSSCLTFRLSNRALTSASLP